MKNKIWIIMLAVVVTIILPLYQTHAEDTDEPTTVTQPAITDADLQLQITRASNRKWGELSEDQRQSILRLHNDNWDQLSLEQKLLISKNEKAKWNQSNRAHKRDVIQAALINAEKSGDNVTPPDDKNRKFYILPNNADNDINFQPNTPGAKGVGGSMTTGNVPGGVGGSMTTGNKGVGSGFTAVPEVRD